MKGSEPMTSVKITTICPGLVDTPLVNTDKATQFSFSKKKALAPGEVAKVMLDLIQDKKYECGTVLELTKGGTRIIPDWNVDPPSGSGTGQDEQDEQDQQQMLRTMLQPIQDTLDTERSSK